MVSTPAPLAPSLSRVKRGNLCSGCGGCSLVAPDKVTMQMEWPGFLRPRQTAVLTAQEDAQIARICPGFGQTVEAGDRKSAPPWGPYLQIETGFATDPDLRHRASSGGALSALLEHLLASSTVDGILQTAADPAVPVGNVTVLSDGPEGIRGAAGSRYAPSAPLSGVAALLDSTKRYAFVGKPCDVAALRAYSAEDSRIDARIPVLVSFFCGGVPSQTGAENVLKTLGTDVSEVAHFRYRGNGWPGRATAVLHDGSERSMTYHESWGKILTRHVQLRCKICADGTGQAADIVCADAWESDERGYPLFEENEGYSLIVARTPVGAHLLAQAREAGKIETTPFDIAQLPDIQPGQRNRHENVWPRLAALACLLRPYPRYTGLSVWQVANKVSKVRMLKNFLGIFKRALRGRL